MVEGEGQGTFLSTLRHPWRPSGGPGTNRGQASQAGTGSTLLPCPTLSQTQRTVFCPLPGSMGQSFVCDLGVLLRRPAGGSVFSSQSCFPLQRHHEQSKDSQHLLPFHHLLSPLQHALSTSLRQECSGPDNSDEDPDVPDLRSSHLHVRKTQKQVLIQDP